MSRPRGRFAEFFAGIGLVRLGLEQAGWRCVFANDHDPKKARDYLRNYPGTRLDGASVNDISAAALPPFDLATASFPCTDLSLAGMRKGLSGGGESGAFYGFAKLIGGLGRKRPRLILLENVPGLLTSHSGRDIIDVLKTLNRLGYAVDMFIMDARWFVPQSRKRLFIVAARGGKRRSGAVCRKVFEDRNPRFRPESLRRVVDAAEGIKWGFLSLPPPPEDSPARLRDVVDTGQENGWWDARRVDALTAQFSERHARELMSLAGGGAMQCRTVYRRVRGGRVRAELRNDEISGCLRPPKGGSSKQILVCAGNGKVMARYLSARECARLQGAPDSFIIPARENEAVFGLGDAVCVPVIKWIGENALNPLAAGDGE